MQTPTTLAIAGIGFSEHEQHLLKSIFALCVSDNHTYTLVDVRSHDAIDIFIVNADDLTAIVQWKAYSLDKPDVPAIMVAEQPLADSQYPYLQRLHLQRPRYARQVLRVLEPVSSGLLESTPINAGGQNNGLCTKLGETLSLSRLWSAAHPS